MPRQLTLADALELFDRKNLACRIPDGRSGQLISVSTNRRNVLRSYMKAAVACATGMHPKDPQLLAVDILPLVAVLP